MRRLWQISVILIALTSLFIILGLREARQPVGVARYKMRVAAMPCTTKPFRVAVIGDLHISPSVTPPERVATVVEQANALNPDLVLLVGDYFSTTWPDGYASQFAGLEPLGKLKPRIATVAILGNNDWQDGQQIAQILTLKGIIVLNNGVVVTPEVAIKGLAELTSNSWSPTLIEKRYEISLKRQRIAPPPLTIWLAHHPAIFDRLNSTGDVLFAGHTHGGQFLPTITLPAIKSVIALGRLLGLRAGWPAEQYVHGVYRSGNKRMIVTSGVGTSILPLRLAVPPEIVLTSFSGCDSSGPANSRRSDYLVTRNPTSASG